MQTNTISEKQTDSQRKRQKKKLPSEETIKPAHNKVTDKRENKRTATNARKP